MAKPIKRLVADLRKGVLSEAEAANLAFGMVQGSSEVPLRYRLGKVTEYDLMVLGVATGADATTAIGDSGRSSRSGVPCPDGIPPGMNVHVCHYDSSHTSITYYLENIDGAPADPDVVPYYVTRWAEVADAAWEYYHSVLDMTPTGDTISVYLGLEAAGKVCGSWPTAQILCGSAIEAFQVDYFAAHEMFHQFQWHYVNRAIFSLYELNPWMESTADWASAHFATTMPRPYGSWTGEAARIKAFFNSTEEGLVSRGEVTDGTLSGERAYGAVAAVEYLTQQTDEALVKESFEAINAGTSDGLAPIDDALALHDWSLEGLIDDLWWAMYTMCDGAEMWSPFGWCNDPWFPVTASGPGTSQTKRPAHETVWLASQPAGSRTFSAHRYGAAFIDFVLASVPDNAYGTSVVLEFDASQVTTDDWVQVVAWKDTPGGELCQTRRMSYPASGGDKTAIAVEIPTGCSYATLVAVNKHTGTGTEAAAFPVSWSTFQSGAVIGNGTVTLGVNADGSLGLGPSHPMPCRGVPAVVAREGSTELGVGPAFVLDVTGHDAIRENDPCGGRPTQGWSLVDPSEVPGGQPSTWSKHGLDYPEAYPVPVASFTSTSTEATSVVRLDGKYTLTQHWHPSSVDPRMYQLDVTIRLATLQPPWTPDPPQLTYRQVVPLNIGRWNSSDHVAAVRGVGDGVTDTTTNLYWSWDPELEPDPGSIDDPLVPLPPSNCDNRHCLGFALDITINSPSVTPPPSPQISIVYGFADSATEAASLLDTAGATTYAIAQTTDWDENTSALVVGYRSTP